MRRLVAARLRHQPAQAVLVTLLAALVSLSAVLGVAYARAVEASVQHQTLADAAASARGVSIGATAASPPSPRLLAERLAPELRSPAWGTSVGSTTADGLVVRPTGNSLVSVVARDGLCERLTIVAGRCLTADEGGSPGQALVSSRALETLRLKVGDALPVADGAGNDTAPVLTLTVVGVYQPYDPAQEYWFDRPITRDDVAGTSIQGGDTVFVDPGTLAAVHWRSLTTSVDVPLALAHVGLGQERSVRQALTRLSTAARDAGASTTTQLPRLLDAAAHQRSDARAALPLLALQIVVLSLVVLGYVAAATTEQRRPEVALARLRGQQPAAAAGLLVRELGVLVVVGALLGGLAGWGLARIAALVWLVPGTGIPLRWPMVAAAGLAALAGLAAGTVVAVPTVREPLVSLLRSVPPRSSALRAGVGDGLVIALCAAGLVTLLSGDPGDPSALVAPGLLALAGGLLLSQAVVPVAGALGRRQLRRGRLRSGLASVAVSRRPALRRLVAIVAVAVALLVFAVAADAVARDQRRVGADQRVGAPVVLTVESPSATALRDAVTTADPSHRYATPVLVARGSNAEGPRSLAVDPQAFGHIAFWDSARTPGSGAPQLDGLRPPDVAPVPLRGSSVQVDATMTATPVSPTPDERPLLTRTNRNAEPGLRGPLQLALDVETADGAVVSVPLGPLARGTTHLAADLPCADGCLLRRVGVQRLQADIGGADLRIGLSLTDAHGRVDLRAADKGWSGIPVVTPVDVSSGPEGQLQLESRSFGTAVSAQRADVPDVLAAVVAGDVPQARVNSAFAAKETDRVEAPAVGGGTRIYQQVGRLPALPGTRLDDGTPGAALLVSYDLVRRSESGLGTRTLQQVWLGADDAPREAGLVRSLEASDVHVVGRTSAAGEAERLASQGSGLALRLALVVGGVALVLAAFVLGVAVATSGRVRAYDLAGLRVVGVPRRVVAGAAVREQLVVALAGVVTGAVLGGIGAALMLSRQATTSLLPPPDVGAAWPTALGAVAGSVVLLCGICLVLGRRLARRAVPGLLVEGAR
jgi:predicted lysophospholipase L1 biosynthesis ABC-type transport system permease subunit